MCYIDLYFLLNWWMDLQILNIADTLLKRHRKRKVRYLLAGIGAFASCIWLWDKRIIVSMVIWLFFYRKDILVVILSCILLGGSFYLIEGGCSLWMMIILPKVILIAIKYIQKRQQAKEVMADVSIWVLGKKIQVRALIDTGNKLYNYGKPVHIIENRCFDFEINPDIYIPFQSVGKDNGVMPAIKVDKIKIVTASNEISLIHSIVGLSSRKLSGDGSYQMLLHSSVERGLYVRWSKCS